MCLHCLVLDRHRQAYFRSVRRVMTDTGTLILCETMPSTSAHQTAVCEGAVESFAAFLELSGGNKGGVVLQKCVAGRWQDVPGKRQYLFGRPRTLSGYMNEFTVAGFIIDHHETWKTQNAALEYVAFLLKKKPGLSSG